MERCGSCVADLLGACQEDFCRAEREALVEEANERAGKLGHTLGKFLKSKGCPVWQALCIYCNKQVVIRLDPAPGEKDIYGEALATACVPPHNQPNWSNPDETD